MHRSDDTGRATEPDFETWRESLRSMCGGFRPTGIPSGTFAGWVSKVSISGLTALNIGSNAVRVERTQRDVRVDGIDHYFVVFHLAGQSAMIHNDQAVQLAASDVVLVDTTLPLAYLPSNGAAPWNCVTLGLPRQSLASHLGFEPQGGIFRRGGTSAGRLLLDIISDAQASDGSTFSPADAYMQLAAYDLVGALFAPSDHELLSRHADKLFKRICNIIKARFADPDFGPCEVAAEAGISLRYLQKLFTAHNSTCSHFIQSVRLDHAARLLHRRVLLNTNQPINEIAYSSGFVDYTHFARRFRRRFGRAPGARPEEPALQATGEETKRAGAGESSS
ncbi:helix-turn-helix domain-containing protein [Bradyrhizobium sp. Ai1a-2]|uniref:helix-turn-helix domain-containing protein n=1 Tax=Bradyrhizobium sp. Ai1a-2 TaxID=196490 RepID=UPI000A049BC6|nr:helix-turn-helix domain-containing protein [Bradyrhizobium sp. Ai1a-2]